MPYLSVSTSKAQVVLLVSQILDLSEPGAKPRTSGEKKLAEFGRQFRQQLASRRNETVNSLADLIRDRIRNAPSIDNKPALADGAPQARGPNVLLFPVDRIGRPDPARAEAAAQRWRFEHDERVHQRLLKTLEDKFGHLYPPRDVEAPDGAA